MLTVERNVSVMYIMYDKFDAPIGTRGSSESATWTHSWFAACSISRAASRSPLMPPRAHSSPVAGPGRARSSASNSSARPPQRSIPPNSGRTWTRHAFSLGIIYFFALHIRQSEYNVHILYDEIIVLDVYFLPHLYALCSLSITLIILTRLSIAVC